MRRLLLAALLLAGACSAPPPNEPGNYGLRPGETMQLVFGLRSLDNAAWSPADSQFATGLQGSYLPEGWPVGFEAGLLYAWDQGILPGAGFPTSVEAWTGEFFVGAHFAVPLGELPIRFYTGAGPVLVAADLESRGPGGFVQDTDWSLGAYGRIGVLFQVVPEAHFGFEYRKVMFTSVTLGGAALDADADDFLLVFGTTF